MRKNRKLTSFVLVMILAVALAATAMAAHHYMGNQYATYGAGRIGLESYIYYGTNTTSNINITSAVSFVRNECGSTAGPVTFSASVQPSGSNSFSKSDYVSVPTGGSIVRSEIAVNRTFAKSNYVFCQNLVQIHDVAVGWDTFIYPSSFSSSFHS